MAGMDATAYAAMDAAKRRALEDFFERMPPTRADRLMRLRSGTVAAAIRRGEIRFIRFPGSDRAFVTPEYLTEWVETRCVHGGRS